jgi:hypothetical protein
MQALRTNTTGTNNISLGYQAGYNLTTGNNNIDIGNIGLAGDTNSIRIGKQGTQTQTYIGGISGAPVTGAAVMVNASGRLGVVMSSARYKHDIRDMGAASSKLLKLRPVTFRYNNDPTNTVQYGLVAEDVAKVYPELVVKGPDAKLMTVRYEELVPMLLNQVQRQAAQIRQLTKRVDQQAEENRQVSAHAAN